MGRLLDQSIKQIINYLSQEGREIVAKAQRTKQVGNQTFNQADAFGYVVYYNGKVKSRGYANDESQSLRPHRGWASENIPEGTGRQWLDEFIETYEAPSTGFVLLIVNAAFYTGIQETKYRYNVISQTFSDLDSIAENFKGAKVKIL